MFGCQRVLCEGRTYTLGEISLYPGFGLWRVGEDLPVKTYPNHLDGWYAAVDDFHALGETVQRSRVRHARAS